MPSRSIRISQRHDPCNVFVCEPTGTVTCDKVLSAGATFEDFGLQLLKECAVHQTRLLNPRRHARTLRFQVLHLVAPAGSFCSLCRLPLPLLGDVASKSLLSFDASPLWQMVVTGQSSLRHCVNMLFICVQQNLITSSHPLTRYEVEVPHHQYAVLLGM